LQVPCPSPFLKWAGGKSQLLDLLLSKVPQSFKSYYEPFLGGGALFFKLCSLGRIRRAVISDSNKDLMNCYVAIRDNLPAMLRELEFLQQHATEKDFYDDVAKPRFNSILLKSGLEGNVEKASLMIYLNKTCYNGLYRVNSSCEYNVPWGRHRSPRIYDRDNLQQVGDALRRPGIELRCADYEDAVSGASRGDFAYLDPPYQPLSQTSMFTMYTPDAFDEEGQQRLARTFRRMDRDGCLVMLSNSWNPMVESIYAACLPNAKSEVVYASRKISCKDDGRGHIREYLITNY